MKRHLTVPFLITGLWLAASLGTLEARQSSTAKPPAQPPKPAAQQPKAAAQAPKPIAPVVPATPVTPPPGYLIGPDDVLQVIYWREKDVSAEVTVRPDGMISLPLLNDVKAAGLTPEQLRDAINGAAKKFFDDPSVTVTIKTINSRRVYITGNVHKPGQYPLTTSTTVLQLIAMAGGLAEYANQKNITIMRVENGKTVTYVFNYKDVVKRKNLAQNIELKPGDTIIVP